VLSIFACEGETEGLICELAESVGLSRRDKRLYLLSMNSTKGSGGNGKGGGGCPVKKKKQSFISTNRGQGKTIRALYRLGKERGGKKKRRQDAVAKYP